MSVLYSHVCVECFHNSKQEEGSGKGDIYLRENGTIGLVWIELSMSEHMGFV